MYVDGYVLPVPKKNLDKYKKIATRASKIWKEHGALDYKECFADDMDSHGMVDFPKLAKTKPDEVVVFSYIVFKSRAHRDSVNKKVMSDKRLSASMEECAKVFNYKRMAYGGFKVAVGSSK